MTGQRREICEMEESFVRFSIENEEQGGITYEEDSTVTSEIDIRWCLIRKFLTELSIDFQSHATQNGFFMATGKRNGMVVDNPRSPRDLLLAGSELKLLLGCDDGRVRCSCRVGTYKTELEGGGVPAAPPA
ncbi:hypothetical protein AgCh_036112 [Apium graveolens]